MTAHFSPDGKHDTTVRRPETERCQEAVNAATKQRFLPLLFVHPCIIFTFFWVPKRPNIYFRALCRKGRIFFTKPTLTNTQTQDESVQTTSFYSFSVLKFHIVLLQRLLLSKISNAFDLERAPRTGKNGGGGVQNYNTGAGCPRDVTANSKAGTKKIFDPYMHAHSVKDWVLRSNNADRCLQIKKKKRLL